MFSTEMDPEQRAALRRVQAHLFAAQTAQGAQHTSVGLMEAFTHPGTPLPSLNYVTPRPKTAFVSESYVQQGLVFLREHGRTPRVQYFDGLMPPPFGLLLARMGLRLERKVGLLLYTPGNNGRRHVLGPAPSGVVAEVVTDARGAAMWWYAWRAAQYDVTTLGAEPLLAGQSLAAYADGHQADLLLHRYGFPVGAARVTWRAGTAHIAALALMRAHATPEFTRWLYAAALELALQTGPDLVFAAAETPDDARAALAVGFATGGSVLHYLHDDDTATSAPEPHAEPLEQPLLDFR